MASKPRQTRERIKRLIRSSFVRDLPLVVAGCAVAALAVDLFMVPNGLAAGGLTGLATILSAVADANGFYLPIGLQTIVMNALLLLFVLRTGGVRYAIQTITGFMLFGFFCDLFMPLADMMEQGELVLSALWGGIISGIGYGLVFRAGGNTGGSDTIAQIISRKTSLPVGGTVMALDVAVCAASIPVFSLTNALYAALSMVLSGYVIDMVVDGGNRERAAFIISSSYDEIAHDIMHGMVRGVTCLDAIGMWSGEKRPMLMVVLSPREVSYLKAIVFERDRDAIVVITDVNEALGEGFKEFGA